MNGNLDLFSMLRNSQSGGVSPFQALQDYFIQRKLQGQERTRSSFPWQGRWQEWTGPQRPEFMPRWGWNSPIIGGSMGGANTPIVLGGSSLQDYLSRLGRGFIPRRW